MPFPFFHDAISTAMKTRAPSVFPSSSLVGDMQSSRFCNREVPAQQHVDNANPSRSPGSQVTGFSPLLSRSSGCKTSFYVMRLSPARILSSWARRNLGTPAKHRLALLALVVCTHKGTADATRHWRCPLRAWETPLSPLRSLPTRAVCACGDLPVVTATRGPIDSQPSNCTGPCSS